MHSFQQKFLQGEQGERGPTGLSGFPGFEGHKGIPGNMGPRGFPGKFYFHFVFRCIYFKVNIYKNK